MTPFRHLTLLLVTATSALAQAGGVSAVHRVRGSVYDSVGRSPLAGAVVEIVMVDSARTGSAGSGSLASFVALTDSAGHFELTNVPTGLYAAAFQHHVLNALGIESPIAGLDLRKDSLVWLNLSIPGGSTVRRQICTGKVEDGLLTGYLLDAHGESPLKNATISIEWDELNVGGGKLKTSHQETKGVPNAAGHFSLCGIPLESPLTLRVSAKGFRDIETEIALPQAGVLSHDFRLASNDTAGSASIRARIVGDSGKALTNGRAMILSLGRLVPVDSGRITIGAIPRGTWVVEVRAIGYQRAVVLLDADEAPMPAATIHMERSPQVLEAVSIVANASTADRKTLAAVDQRIRAGSGTLILAGDLSLRNALYATDGLSYARGFRRTGSEVQARPFSQGISMQSCRSLEFPKIGTKTLVVYLDGVRVPFGLQGVNDMVRPEEILAIEAYPDVISAPGIWKTNDACAVVAFWTKR